MMHACFELACEVRQRYPRLVQYRLLGQARAQQGVNFAMVATGL